MRFLRRMASGAGGLFYAVTGLFTRRGRKIFWFAMRNLRRHHKRTWITAAVIMFGLGIFLWSDGLMQWVQKQSLTNLHDHETAHLKIMKEKFFEEKDLTPLEHSVPDAERIVGLVEKAGYAATPRVATYAQAINPDGYAVSYSMIGYDRETDGRVFRTFQTMATGRPPENAYEVAMGVRGAEQLGLQIGYPVKIDVPTRYGQQQVLHGISLSGTVDCPTPNIDRRTIFVPLDLLEDPMQGLGMEGAATEIAVRIGEHPKPKEIEEAKARLERILADAGETDLVVKTWAELVPDVVVMIKAEEREYYIILFLISIIAVVGIANTLLMAVYERIREIGTLRAMGMKAREIIASFIYEGSGIGLLGSLVGVALGVTAILLTKRYGLNYGVFIGDIEFPFPVDMKLMRAEIHVPALIFGVVFCTAIAALTSILPASRGGDVEITDALRWE